LDWFQKNYDWYGFFLAINGLLCSIHPLNSLLNFRDEKAIYQHGDEGKTWHVAAACIMIILFDVMPMMIWLVVQYWVLPQAERRGILVLLHTIKSRFGGVFTTLYGLASLFYVGSYSFLGDYNDLNAYKCADHGKGSVF